MRFKISSALAGLSIGLTVPLLAQQPDWVTQILTAAQLPVATDQARQEGVANAEIRAVLDAMAKAGLPAHEATAVIDTARVARRENGPVDNFGAFVQSQLRAGKRGPALAAAIRAEHARQGKGNATRGAPGKARGKSDSAEDSVRGQGRGRSNAKPAAPPTAALKSHENRGQGHATPAKPHR